MLNLNTDHKINNNNNNNDNNDNNDVIIKLIKNAIIICY